MINILIDNSNFDILLVNAYGTCKKLNLMARIMSAYREPVTYSMRTRSEFSKTFIVLTELGCVTNPLLPR